MRKNNVQLDIYFGDDLSHTNTDINGMSVINRNINDITNIIDTYGELELNKYNFRKAVGRNLGLTTFSE